jgi:exopolysaccharide biosynthesis polyprenyl glycosylphosphotransferase
VSTLLEESRAADVMHADGRSAEAALPSKQGPRLVISGGEVLPRRQTRRGTPSSRWLLDARAILLTDLFVMGLGAALGSADGPVGAIAVATLVPAIAILGARGQYSNRVRLRFFDDLPELFLAVAIAAVLFVLLRWGISDAIPVTDAMVAGWLMVFGFLLTGRAALAATRTWVCRRTAHGRRTLVIGADHVAHVVAGRLKQRPDFGLLPLGFLAYAGGGAADPDLPVWGTPDELERVAREQKVEHVVVSSDPGPEAETAEFTRRCHEMGLGVSHVPRLFECVSDRWRVDRLGGLPLVSLPPGAHRGWRMPIKYVLDRFVASLLLILASPLLGVVAFGVLVTMGRPVFFRQRRTGLNRRQFEMLKFRTMEHQQDGQDVIVLPEGLGPGGVEGEYDRRTRFGRFLRRTSLDELPQLINAVRGEMSLVGPRPERPEFAERFVSEVYRYADRHRIKPGITGWAQVHGYRGRTPLVDRVELDNYYIENWSPWLDARILMLTLGAIVFDRPE